MSLKIDESNLIYRDDYTQLSRDLQLSRELNTEEVFNSQYVICNLVVFKCSYGFFIFLYVIKFMLCFLNFSIGVSRSYIASCFLLYCIFLCMYFWAPDYLILPGLRGKGLVRCAGLW